MCVCVCVGGGGGGGVHYIEILQSLLIIVNTNFSDKFVT